MNEPTNRVNVQRKMEHIKSIACIYIVKNCVFRVLPMLSKKKMECLYLSSISTAGRASGLTITFNFARRRFAWRTDSQIDHPFLSVISSILAHANVYRFFSQRNYVQELRLPLT